MIRTQEYLGNLWNGAAHGFRVGAEMLIISQLTLGTINTIFNFVMRQPQSARMIVVKI